MLVTHYCHNCGYHRPLADGVYCHWCRSFFYAHGRMSTIADPAVVSAVLQALYARMGWN